MICSRMRRRVHNGAPLKSAPRGILDQVGCAELPADQAGPRPEFASPCAHDTEGNDAISLVTGMAQSRGI